MRIGGFRMGWLRQRWWVIVVSIVGVTAIGFALQPGSSSTYTGETVLIVRSGATTNTPGSANEANRLAVTYSQLISQDTQVLDRVSRVLNVTPAEAQKHISVVNDADTSILRARYASSNANTAVNGARAIADALAGPNPASSNFNGVGLSRLPDKATASDASAGTIPLSFLLGLALGVVLVIAWERVDGKIESVEDVEYELGCPTTALERLSSNAIVALSGRWYALAGQDEARVAVVGGAPGYRAVAHEVTSVFAATLSGAQSDAEFAASPFVNGSSFIAAGAPGTYEVGESAVQGAEVVVMVVPYGARIRDVRKSLAFLRDFGVAPQWGLYASERIIQRASNNRPVDDAVTLDVREPVTNAVT